MSIDEMGMPKPLKPLVPSTKITRIAVVLIMLVAPVMLYKSYCLLTGRPIDYYGRTVAILTGIGLFGMITGFLLLSIEVFRSAGRE